MSRTILVIEDLEDTRRILLDLLTDNGYNVIEATTGKEGINAAASHRPDLIVMDIQLPGIDGYEAAKRIRSIPDFQKTPIIPVTAHALRGDDKKKAFAAGWDAYIAKPFSLNEFLATIRRYLQQPINSFERAAQ